MTGPTYSYYPPHVLPERFCVVRGDNDLLITEDGGQYIDLLSGSGTVFLGHANPSIARRIKEQLDVLWNTGAVPTRLAPQAFAAVETFLPASHGLAALYSTGMEAAEFALRVARHVTGRKGLVGFHGAMHGKSMGTARLGWPNPLANLPDFHSVAYLPEATEEQTLKEVRAALATESVAAVFLEPLLASRGGHIPSAAFARTLSALCGEHGALLVLDEIFTGFYRTGSLFLHQDLGVTPDILLIGKAMGNGFPVSGVVVDRRYPIEGRMLPGSTFAGNPIAAAAVLGTLEAIRNTDMAGLVQAIERTILEHLGDALAELDIALRGRGALWLLEFPLATSVPQAMERIVRAGVMVSPTANFIRLLPAATIRPDHLAHACEVIRTACR